MSGHLSLSLWGDTSLHCQSSLEMSQPAPNSPWTSNLQSWSFLLHARLPFSRSFVLWNLVNMWGGKKTPRMSKGWLDLWSETLTWSYVDGKGIGSLRRGWNRERVLGKWHMQNIESWLDIRNMLLSLREWVNIWSTDSPWPMLGLHSDKPIIMLKIS